MVQVATVEPTSPKRSDRNRRPGSKQATTNNILAGLLIAIVFCSTLFFGGVHPFFWGVAAAALGATATWYSFTLRRQGETFRIKLRQTRPQTVLFALTCAFLIIQILPFGLFKGPINIAASGDILVQSNTISVAPQMTILMLIRQLSFGLFFFLMLQASANEGRRRLMTNILLVIVIAFAALGIISLQLGDTVLGIPKTSYQGSATGPFVNRNSFATFLGFGAILALGKLGSIVVTQRQRHVHDGIIAELGSSVVIYFTAYAILLGTIVATQSRMGLAATLVASAAVGAIIMWKAKLNIIAILVMTLLAASTLVLGILYYGETLFDRVVTTGQSAEQRGDLYAQIWELILRRPWTGYGGGSFEVAYPLVHRFPVTASVVWDKAHSSYLALWSDLGLIAGSLPMILLALLAIRLFAAILKDNANWLSPTIALGALILGAVHSTVDFSLEIEANAFLLLAVLGMGVASTYQLQK